MTTEQLSRHALTLTVLAFALLAFLALVREFPEAGEMLGRLR